MTDFSKGFEPTNGWGIPNNVYRAIVAMTALALAKTVDLTFSSASDIPVDASLGSIFDLTLEGDVTIGAPSNPVDGQRITFRIEQGVGGNAVAWDSIYRFSTDLPSPTITSTIYFYDILEFVYNENANYWDCIKIVQGFDNTPV